MTAITLNSMNLKPDSGLTAPPVVMRLGNPSGTGTRSPVSSGPVSNGLFTGRRRSQPAGRIYVSPEPRGLGRIESKAPRRPVSEAVRQASGSLAGVWIGIPFAAVFVLGCLTLG
jgi:hypothetical protein